jgi:hypothetical protein
MTFSDLSDYPGNLWPELEAAEAGTLPSWVDEVIVVNGHSTDDIAPGAWALRPDAKVIAQPGAGDALMAGPNRAETFFPQGALSLLPHGQFNNNHFQSIMGGRHGSPKRLGGVAAANLCRNSDAERGA